MVALKRGRARQARVLEEDYGNGVMAVTVIGHKDITYMVKKDDEAVWSKVVEGIGGAGRQQARRACALEQDEIALREAKRRRTGRRR